jgi:hypothetical protein
MNYAVVNSYGNSGNKNCPANGSEKKKSDHFTPTDSVQIMKIERIRYR